jgi:hypothetical protein
MPAPLNTSWLTASEAALSAHAAHSMTTAATTAGGRASERRVM